MSTTETLVFLAVIGSRFFVPLLIPKFPLPTIIVCLVLDAADQSIFQAMGYDPPGYQSYDKAMDVWYLAMAWLSTLRNWSSLAAFSVSRFLYFYRLVGVVAFELSGVRALLLVFPNTFEYFFIAYEGIRSRWRTVRWGLKWWIGVAAFIWIFIKLPQEYWIHVAQLDFTDALANNPWFGPLIVALIVIAAGAFWIWGRPRLLPADHALRFTADPLPEEMDTAAKQIRDYAAQGSVLSTATLEKVFLLGLLSVIFSQTLPGVRSSNIELFIGIAAVVVINAAATLALSRREISVQSTVLAFGARMLGNVALVGLAAWLLPLGQDGDINVFATMYFLTMISLLTTFHDRWSPIYRSRVAALAAAKHRLIRLGAASCRRPTSAARCRAGTGAPGRTRTTAVRSGRRRTERHAPARGRSRSGRHPG